MVIIVIARHPAAAEALSPLLESLGKRHKIFLYAVRNYIGAPFGGAGEIFDRREKHYCHINEYEGRKIDQLRFPIPLAREIISKISPACIIAGCSYDKSGEVQGIEEAFIKAGSELGTCSFQVVDGFDTWYAHEGVEPTSFIVPDEFTSKIMQYRSGFTINADKIFISGQLLLQSFLSLNEKINTQKEDTSILNTRPVVGFFGQAVSGNDEILDLLKKCVRKVSKIYVAKHPRDEVSWISDSIDDTIENHKGSSDDLLRKIGVSITRWSTMGIKSALMGIPTINIIRPGELSDVFEVLGGYPLTLAGGSVAVSSHTDLLKALDEVKKPDIQGILDSYKIGKDAVKSAVNHIESTVEDFY